VEFLDFLRGSAIALLEVLGEEKQKAALKMSCSDVTVWGLREETWV
jgi:hypothetical protein